MSEPHAPGSTSLGAVESLRQTRRGLRLAWFTVVYNLAEGVIAVTAGLMAGLVSLVGFGLDSGLFSAERGGGVATRSAM